MLAFHQHGMETYESPTFKVVEKTTGYKSWDDVALTWDSCMGGSIRYQSNAGDLLERRGP